MSLIDRYVAAVMNELPKSDRDSSEKELREKISSMLSDQPSEADVRGVLEQLGHPGYVADEYRKEKRYLIGPKIYRRYIDILKLLLMIVPAVAAAGALIAGISQSPLDNDVFGLFLYALGIVLTMNAQIGYAPWDVLHVGLAKTTGLSVGTVSIVAGVVIGLITVFFGEKLGLGTILNMVLIGVFLDLLLAFRIIPSADNYLWGIIMMILGLFIIAIASYFYIGSAFGAGPRDSLMVTLTRKTRLPVGVCRGTIEVLAVVIGWKLGGMVGIGTIISAFMIGFCVQITFKLLKFDATKVKHETLTQTFKFGKSGTVLHLPKGE